MSELMNNGTVQSCLLPADCTVLGQAVKYQPWLASSCGKQAKTGQVPVSDLATLPDEPDLPESISSALIVLLC
jgi:hypothetical protein